MAKPPSNRKKAASAASTDSTSAASSVNEDISQQVDPGSATITVTAVEVEELSEAEQSDRLHLERIVSGRFLKQGRRWQNCAIAEVFALLKLHHLCYYFLSTMPNSYFFSFEKFFCYIVAIYTKNGSKMG